MQQLKNDTFRPGRFEVPGKLLPFGEEYWDNSIGQFCLLALWATRKYNIRVDRTLVVEEQRYRRQQLGDGSWYYREAVQGQRDATTCAGLIGLAVGKAIQDEMNKGMGEKNKNVKVLNDPKIKDGLEFLSRVIGKESRLSKREKKKRRELTERIDDLNRALLESRQRKPAEIKRDIEKLDTDELATGIYFGGDAWGDLYLLWSMERVAVIYGLDKINGKDWYGWGKEIILDNQERDGSWRERFPGVPDTCFALLFLKRANIAKDLTDKLQRLTAMLGIGAPPEDRNRPPADRQGLPPRRDA